MLFTSVSFLPSINQFSIDTFSHDLNSKQYAIAEARFLYVCEVEIAAKGFIGVHIQQLSTPMSISCPPDILQMISVRRPSDFLPLFHFQLLSIELNVNRGTKKEQGRPGNEAKINDSHYAAACNIRDTSTSLIIHTFCISADSVAADMAQVLQWALQ